MGTMYDENTSKSDKYLEEHPDDSNVKYKVGVAADDILEILPVVKKEDAVLCTKDTRFALAALINGIKVWYIEGETGREYRLTAKQDEF